VSALNFALACLLAASSLVQAQDRNYPQAPIKIVVGATPGGTVDTVARLLAQDLAVKLKQPALVDNRPGANGAIAAEAVVKAKPDGYTLLLGTSGLTALPVVQKNVPYQLNRDLRAVAITSFTPFLLFSGPTSNASSVANLVAYAKANPQKLSVASGDGTTLLASEMFKAATGITALSVNYRGGPQMITDIASGAVDFGFLGATAVIPLAKVGKLRVLAVASDKRLAVAPDVATLAELGVRGSFLEPWTGIMVPRETERSIVQILDQALAAIAQSEAFQKKIAEIGSTVRYLDSDAASAYIVNEQKRLEQAASEAGIKPAD
jgi:tripartite-type tricarboxylate transporter receptor subunit TctC